MTSNWTALEKKLPPGLGMLGTIVSICTSSFTQEEQSQKVRAFFEKDVKSTKGFDQTLAQSLDAIAAKSKWVGRDREDVEGWLKEKGYLQ